MQGYGVVWPQHSGAHLKKLREAEDAAFIGSVQEVLPDGPRAVLTKKKKVP